MIDKHYDPHAIEARWYAAWQERGLFHGDPARGGEAYCVMLPPPNVTGILHMGHALNITIQDILVRWRRMQGRNVVWMPGTDHAGIATQNVVERALRAEGKTREDLGRAAFVDRVWQWRAQYGGAIVNQLKRLGASCDWERERFTMDEALSEAVTEVFVRLYDKGLIYRGNYIVNWCPRCRTALSDEESEHVDTAGKLYYIRYPLKGGARTPGGRDHLVVATTRPETLLGDVAVAVNPQDARYADLADRTPTLPLLGRELTVVQDSFVDPAFGTGIVKVTPAHDPNDFELGQRHQLAPINVMHDDGTMNDAAGSYAGLDRFACRDRVVRDLDAQGLIEKIEEHRHAVGHCYRCDTVVEPRLSPQWFVKMKPLAEPALQAVLDGRIEFIPGRWEKVYREWMENIRDWCISRQIWWGHRIPVFTCSDCEHVWAAKGRPTACPACNGGNLAQDEDVLDTWFSSWLWPFSAFGWPRESSDLAFYYPTQDLATASEIIFFWVARMVMAGFEFMGDIPFSKVYIHGTVRDDQGRKMSKSLGNSIDPLDIIDAYSADALRFSLTMLTATGQDVYVSTEKFELGRNFGTKLWNAARYLRMNSEGFAPRPSVARLTLDVERLSFDDRFLLAKLSDAVVDCTASLEQYRFNDAARVLYEFVWHTFCDWYVEYAKGALNGDDPAQREQVLRIMHHTFAVALRLLHPSMPFVTEELWHAMGYADASDSIMIAPWPTPLEDNARAAWGITAEIVAYVTAKQDMIRVGRQLRADYNIPPAQKLSYLVKPSAAGDVARLTADRPAIASALRASDVVFDAALAPAAAMPSALSAIGAVYMPIAGVIDVAAERKRLSGELAKAEEFLTGANKKLDNANFVGRAPADVVAAVRTSREALVEKVEKLQRMLDALAS
jgi:valyl-tRNA synthetase